MCSFTKTEGSKVKDFKVVRTLAWLTPTVRSLGANAFVHETGLLLCQQSYWTITLRAASMMGLISSKGNTCERGKLNSGPDCL